MSASGESGAGAVVTVMLGLSLAKAMNTGTSPGLLASALARTASSDAKPGASPDDPTPGMP